MANASGGVFVYGITGHFTPRHPHRIRRLPTVLLEVGMFKQLHFSPPPAFPTRAGQKLVVFA
jgi:hypothetical protein